MSTTDERFKQDAKQQEVPDVVPAAQRTIPVKLVKLGTAPTTVQLMPGACTLDDALAGVDTKGLNVRVNGVKVSGDTCLAEHDIITIIPQIRGGH